MPTLPWSILVGDARASLAGIPDRSVHCCVTSPPYWSLRSYSTDPQVWGGDPLCDHLWNEHRQYRDSPTRTGGEGIGFDDADTTRAQRWTTTNFCSRCGGWRGELGSEPDPDSFVAHLVEVFREVRRVLRPDGTCWIHAYPVLTHPDTLGTSLEGGYPCRWRRARRSERSLRGATC